MTNRRRRLINGASASSAVLILALVLTLSPEAGAGKGANRSALKAPTSLRVASATATAVTVEWSLPHPYARVAGYGIYVGSTKIAETTSTSYTLTGLACGTTMSISVDAFDAAGNRSDPASILVATAACVDTQPPSMPVDTQAPSAPTRLNQSTATPSAVTVSWTGATDNVLVAGYGVYLDGVSVASTQGASATLSGLLCSKTYSVGVDAFDAAGNRSAATTATVTTVGCAPTSSALDNGWKGSLNASYAAAAPGATIEVPAGTLTMDYPSEGAVKIVPATKSSADPITFVCKGDGDVIFPEGQLVITARNVVMRGACFKMKKLWVGDPANGVSTSNVTIDGVFMQTFDISGSDLVTVKNSDVGPSVGSASNPRYYQPKVHSGGNTGGVPPTNIVLDNLTIHDMQTTDPVAYHTGGLWVGYGTTGSLTVRNSRFMRNAVYDIHVDQTSSWNLTLEGNTFGPPVEPLSNTNGGAETQSSFTELQVKCQNGQLLKNYTLTGNTWKNGWNLVYGGCTGATYEGLTISGNTGGSTRNPAAN